MAKTVLRIEQMQEFWKSRHTFEGADFRVWQGQGRVNLADSERSIHKEAGAVEDYTEGYWVIVKIKQ